MHIMSEHEYILAQWLWCVLNNTRVDIMIWVFFLHHIPFPLRPQPCSHTFRFAPYLEGPMGHLGWWFIQGMNTIDGIELGLYMTIMKRKADHKIWDARDSLIIFILDGNPPPSPKNIIFTSPPKKLIIFRSNHSARRHPDPHYIQHAESQGSFHSHVSHASEVSLLDLLIYDLLFLSRRYF